MIWTVPTYVSWKSTHNISQPKYVNSHLEYATLKILHNNNFEYNNSFPHVPPYTSSPQSVPPPKKKQRNWPSDFFLQGTEFHNKPLLWIPCSSLCNTKASWYLTGTNGLGFAKVGGKKTSTGEKRSWDRDLKNILGTNGLLTTGQKRQKSQIYIGNTMETPQCGSPLKKHGWCVAKESLFPV